MPDLVKVVKVRRVGKNAEQVLHAPSTITGWYEMNFNEETGEIRYRPVKV